jgi:UDP-glucose 4-epimerase
MKIFITGVAGFLGSHIADKMLALGHSVTGNDTLIGGYLDNLDPRIEFHTVDCCDYETLKTIMNNSDIVIHTAAMAR